MKDANKGLRIIDIFQRLSKGTIINKKEEAQKFGVSTKTIGRDINDLRDYLSQDYELSTEITYCKNRKGYILKREGDNWLSNQEVLGLTRVLLESRAFKKEEMEELLDKLVLQSAPEDRKGIKEIIGNERFHYVPVNHNQSLLEKIWDLSQAVREKRIIEIEYQKQGNDNPAKRRIKPLGVIFSEYYFYLIAQRTDFEDDFKIVYRLDRIVDYQLSEDRFRVVYKDRFKEGEFRKRVQFMYAGGLMKVKFKFTGSSLEAVLDRLATAKVVKEDEDGYLIKAEVFGKGIKMWLLSQGKNLEVIEPIEFREEMKETIEMMRDNYS